MRLEHNLKCWPDPWRQTRAGQKPFEVRKNDRGYAVGDVLRLWHWRPDLRLPSGWVITVTVTAMAQGLWGLPPDLCVLGFNPAEASATAARQPERAADLFAAERLGGLPWSAILALGEIEP